MTSNYSPDVVFNAGSPIDVNKLNQLQRNIASVYEQNSSLVATTNATVDTVSGIQKTVRVFPIVHTNTIDITVPAESCAGQDITFAGTSFTATPILVASVSSDINKDTRFWVRATAKSSAGGRIEVCTSNKTQQKVTVNYIAIQMKTIE